MSILQVIKNLYYLPKVAEALETIIQAMPTEQQFTEKSWLKYWMGDQGAGSSTYRTYRPLDTSTGIFDLGSCNPANPAKNTITCFTLSLNCSSGGAAYYHSSCNESVPAENGCGSPEQLVKITPSTALVTAVQEICTAEAQQVLQTSMNEQGK